MDKKDAKKNMKVVFGRGGERAAKAVGIIQKCNPARAKVKITEQFNSNPPGSVFNVPYEMMEPMPKSGNKNDVEISQPGRGGNAEIIVGETTFRSVYADSNALWKVIKKEGRNYRCRIENEPVEIDGRMYDGDYAGTERIFSPEQIRGAIGLSNLFHGLHDQHEAFYKGLVPGQTIHYQNGFDNWVRCEVVVANGENVLKPVALVGEWADYDMPRRRANGEIDYGYYPQKIMEGSTFTPNASNLFENGCKPRNGVDPTTLTPLSLAVPEMDTDEAAIASLWKKIERIDGAVRDRSVHPQAILDNVQNILDE